MRDRIGQEELLALIGEDAFIALAENFGGRRLYVPGRLPADHEISRAIGADAALRLSERISPDVIKVPLARELRARQYRAYGLSHGEIATRLGITETAVEKIFRRMDKPPSKGCAIKPPIPLFPDL